MPTYPTFKETHTPKKKRLQLDQIITDTQNGDIAYYLSLQRQAKLKYCINGAIQTIQLSDDLNEKYQQLCDGIYTACDKFSQTTQESPFRKNNAYWFDVNYTGNSHMTFSMETNMKLQN